MNQQDKDRLREIAKDYEDFDLGALIFSLLEENEALARDAARYRWLRDSPLYEAPTGSLIEAWLFSRPTATAAAFDFSIDAAMQPKGDNHAQEQS